MTDTKVNVLCMMERPTSYSSNVSKRITSLQANEACVKIAAAVGLNNCLERLDLLKNNIEDDGCESLEHRLTTNTDLKCLCLSDNKSIGTYGCGALARTLEEKHSLERLEAPIGDDQDCRLLIDECLNNNHKNNSNRATATIDHQILNDDENNEDGNNTTDTKVKELCMMKRRRMRLYSRSCRLAHSCEGAPTLPVYMGS